MTPDRELDKMVDADIEDWMEARENEGYKWGEQLEIFNED